MDKKSESLIQKAYSIKKKSLSKEASLFNILFTYSIRSLYAASVHSILECTTGSLELFIYLDFKVTWHVCIVDTRRGIVSTGCFLVQ